MVLPSDAVVAASMFAIAGWAALGLVKYGMVNEMAAFARNVLNAIAPSDIVKIKGAVSVRAAVPDGVPAVGEVNVRATVPECARDMPSP